MVESSFSATSENRLIAQLCRDDKRVIVFCGEMPEADEHGHVAVDCLL
jgi:hypothetical protein